MPASPGRTAQDDQLQLFAALLIVNLLHVKGITRVVGMLLYVTPLASEVHALPAWWSKRGERLLDRLAES